MTFEETAPDRRLIASLTPREWWHRDEAEKAVHALGTAALTRWPAALDEIDRLRAEADALRASIRFLESIAERREQPP